ncbi:hypothetical protein F0U59_42120 [Archangium gephyra]|nr:hypothetical protein F0U59_42120 [Archangium gephyra]
MTWGGHALRSLLVVLLLVGLPATAGAKQPSFRAEGMVPLPGGALLVWSSDGRLQVGAPEEGWSPVVRLPMTYVTSVVPEAEGALVGGSNFPKGGTESAVAIAVDSRGAVRTRWQGGAGLFNSVTSSQGRRWAVALDELVELLPDGRTESAGKVPSLSQLLLGPEGQRVLCKPANLTLAHAAPAECGSSSPVEWRVRGSWKRSPLLCGEWFVTQEGSELRVVALTDGREVARRASQAEAVACGGPSELLAADKQVQALALPSLEVRWAAPCGRGSVTALVATPEGGVCLEARGSVTRFKRKDSQAPSRNQAAPRK